MKTLAKCMIVLTLTGCAGANYRPLVDTKGVDLNRLESDLGECQQYASQVAGAGSSAAAGAIAGALFGAILAAAAGKGYDQGATARVGLVTGALGGGMEGDNGQRSVVKNCMAGRGYRVMR